MSYVSDPMGLDDHASWLGLTLPKRGLMYRGDSDFEQLGPRGLITVAEFKKQNEKPLGPGQAAYLKRRAQDERTEVLIVRETSTDYFDADRIVRYTRVGSGIPEQHVPLSVVKAYIDSRAYLSPRESSPLS